MVESHLEVIQHIPAQESVYLGAECSHMNTTHCRTQVGNSLPQETSKMPEACIT